MGPAGPSRAKQRCQAWHASTHASIDKKSLHRLCRQSCCDIWAAMLNGILCGPACTATTGKSQDSDASTHHGLLSPRTHLAPATQAVAFRGQGRRPAVSCICAWQRSCGAGGQVCHCLKSIAVSSLALQQVAVAGSVAADVLATSHSERCSIGQAAGGRHHQPAWPGQAGCLPSQQPASGHTHA